eukprot:gnl/Chilomastix_caulleri/4912.p2 GENE.gnl/Chilomastix_caulleri/4912~~gnl/Chilomastix_caulleri/4912.p2  ORF type:complete len:62 (+),score=13.41 gnl/Chilomastix_caulleri/4912:135-320(+)
MVAELKMYSDLTNELLKGMKNNELAIEERDKKIRKLERECKKHKQALESATQVRNEETRKV